MDFTVVFRNIKWKKLSSLIVILGGVPSIVLASTKAAIVGAAVGTAVVGAVVAIAIALSQSSSNGSNNYSNFIIFGDSLSDTGNFPEPHNIDTLGIPESPVTPSTAPYNVYMPISNPVPNDLHGRPFNIPTVAPAVTWSYPTSSFLSTASLEQGTINGAPRDQRSINWPEYFVYNYFKQRYSFAMPSYKMITWYRLTINPTDISANTSLNFAYAGALTIDGFATAKWKSLPEMLETTLITKNKDYRNGTNPILLDVPVPGMLKQISFYNADYLKDKALQDNQHSAYIIYIGANDIGKALDEGLLHGSGGKTYLRNAIGTSTNINSLGTIAQNVSKAINTLITQDHAKHIFVVTLLNITNLPRFYQAIHKFPLEHNPTLQTLARNIGTDIVESYNAQLASIALSSDGKVKIINLGGALNSLTQTPRFIGSVSSGDECIEKKIGALSTDPSINNCNIDEAQSTTYFAWNQSHLSSPVNQFAAYIIDQGVNQSTEESENTAKQLEVLGARADSEYPGLLNQWPF